MPEITVAQLLCRFSNAFFTRKGSSLREVTLFGGAIRFSARLGIPPPATVGLVSPGWQSLFSAAF
jgi:hypothetical protein